MIRPPLAASAAALMLTAGLTTGCGALTLPPEEHSDLLTTATGVSTFELVVTPDLWDKTTLTARDELQELEGSDPGGDLSDRGLELYTLSGAQLVTYLDHLRRKGHGGWLERSGTPEVHQRVYDEITPVVEQIDGPRGEEEPAPRVVLDDTITQP
ncbi:hypothetical protein ACWFMI_23095 [Nocardiopsis terrae]|uniref:hypothetical protein n=1 Tax=Streptomyces sp. NPDC057554 TaxID=3350538 RepID=UPI003685A2EB